MTELAERARFTNFMEGTAEEWRRVSQLSAAAIPAQARRLIGSLRTLIGDHCSLPVDRYEHSLQAATRAYRANRDDEYVMCALMHDVGHAFSAGNHAEVGAALLKPFVSADNYWMLEKHGIFQGYYFHHYTGGDRYAREQWSAHACYDRTVEFCHDFDQAAFDPAYKSMRLEEFEPMVIDLLSTRRSQRVAAP
jgi:predicted HD phosphohydrolase